MRRIIRSSELTWAGLRGRLAAAGKPTLVVGFVGYMLSPFSPYNDLVVNVLPSYALARWVARVVPVPIPGLTVVFYILSNVVGLAILLGAARRLGLPTSIVPSRKHVALVVVYVIVVVVGLALVDPMDALRRLGIVR